MITLSRNKLQMLIHTHTHTNNNNNSVQRLSEVHVWIWDSSVSNLDCKDFLAFNANYVTV